MTSDQLTESLTGTSLAQVERFQRSVLNYPVPDKPQKLPEGALDLKVHHLQEEIDELRDAKDTTEMADAFVDLAYVALGGLIQMGICPGPAFEEVHNANMRRKRVDEDRTGGDQPDARKPEDWRGPDWEKLLSVTLDDIDWLTEQKAQADEYKGEDDPHADDDEQPKRITLGEAVGTAADIEVKSGGFGFEDCTEAPKRMTGGDRSGGRPKVIVMGYAQHGKDTVGEMLRHRYLFSFTSSSMFCSETIVYPMLKGSYGYPDAEACYEDRANHRDEWFDLIRRFNTPDLMALGRSIFAKHDVYCGIRNAAEFHALRNAGVFDFAIWVDGSERHRREPKSSCSVESWMADYVLDNNGDLDDLERGLTSLMTTILERHHNMYHV